MIAPTFVLLGASGDLAARLILPALARLDAADQLGDLRVVGYALERWSPDEFRAHAAAALDRGGGDADGERRRRFLGRLDYLPGELTAASLGRLGAALAGPAIFYLALPPSVFADAAGALGEAGLAAAAGGWRRLVVEKPFGWDLESARALNRDLHAHWQERQIFRIDHFLGKETVQNLLVFRFANRFLDPVLNSHHVSHVEITASETLGLEGRTRYYDGIGALRDMLQNHLMQLFSLCAIEPPSEWDADVLRGHKVEVLKSVRPIRSDEVDACAVRGRYTRGVVDGRQVPGYLEEPGVPASSRTETFAALKLRCDNWRWSGVPFYLRSGKRLGRALTEIAFTFRRAPTRLFRATPLEEVGPNRLVFRIRPDEGIDLEAIAKRPGLALESHRVVLHASYAGDNEKEFAAYEQLLLDVVLGDRMSFLRFDEVEWSWRVIAPVLEAWKSGDPEPYPSGSEGPPSQARILEKGHRWRPLAGG